MTRETCRLSQTITIALCVSDLTNPPERVILSAEGGVVWRVARETLIITGSLKKRQL
jgi:hypothetical protein